MKTIRHLEKNPTFEELVRTGETWDFPADAEVFGRAAINFKNSWYGGVLGPPGSVVDENHDDKVEKVLAAMKAFADQQEQRSQQRRKENRNMFAENLPRANTEAEHAHPSTSTQTSTPGTTSSTQTPEPRVGATNFGELGQRGSAPTFLEKMAKRQAEHPKEVNKFTFRKDITRERTEARQKVERGRNLHHKRQNAATAANNARAQQFNINTPPPSPDPSPPRALKGKYDQRLLRAQGKRNPKPEMHRPPRQETKDILQQKRGIDIRA